MLVPWDSHITKLSELIRLAKPSWVGRTVFVDVLLSTSWFMWKICHLLAKSDLAVTGLVSQKQFEVNRHCQERLKTRPLWAREDMRKLITLPSTLYTLHYEFFILVLGTTHRTWDLTMTWTTVSVVTLPLTTKTWRLCSTNYTHHTPANKSGRLITICYIYLNYCKTAGHTIK